MDVEIPPSSGDAETDSLVERRWLGTQLSFGFPAAAGEFTGYADGEPFNNFEALNAVQQAAVRTIFASISSFTNLTFSEITGADAGAALLRFGMTDDTPTAHAYLPVVSEPGGDSWYRNSGGQYDNPQLGNYAWLTFMHEIGHALGFGHPHQSTPPMDVYRDWMPYTVMSYRSGISTDVDQGYSNEDWGFAQTYMMEDIAALQFLYGANFNYNSSDTVYSWSTTTGEMFINGVGQGAPGENRIFMTVWDGGGTDTYDFSNYINYVDIPFLTINLDPGSWTDLAPQQNPIVPAHSSPGNVANALLYNNDPRSLIENVIGSPLTDFINGNSAANYLFGGLGTDYIYGGFGDDIIDGGGHTDNLYGGDGNDTLYGGSDDNHDYMRGEAGNDVLYGGGGTDDLRGGDGDDRLEGEAGADSLESGAGNDILIGGVGGDTMTGSIGNDIYYIDTWIDPLPMPNGTFFYFVGIDWVNEAVGEGYDRIIATVSFSLPAGIEVETIEVGNSAGADAINLSGNAWANTIYGNAGVNWLRGGAGNDTLIGGGGADQLLGGAGADVFVYTAPSESGVGQEDSLSDFAHGADLIDLRAFEIAGMAFEAMESGTPNAWTRVVISPLTGVPMALRVAGIASEADFLFTLGIPDVTLVGTSGDDALAGGAGNDTLDGGAGDDLVDGGAGADFVGGGDGQDWLSGGDGNDGATGGTGHDSVWGDAGDDLLDGAEGDDTMWGGAGIDTVTYAGAGAGVEVDLSWLEEQDTRGAGWDTLVGIENLVGSAFDDRLSGDGAVNDLRAGAGADVLTGGGGNDAFHYGAGDSTTAAPDLITDFAPGDQIVLYWIDADTGTGGDQAFHLGATAGHTGDVVLAFDAGNDRTSLSFYVDGDAVVDGLIWLTGDHTALTGADFIL